MAREHRSGEILVVNYARDENAANVQNDDHEQKIGEELVRLFPEVLFPFGIARVLRPRPSSSSLTP